MSENNLPLIKEYQKYMLQAFKLAEEAYDEGEIPVGAIIVKDEAVVGKGYNQTERLTDPTGHAEILAISAACSTLDNKYLNGCTIFVTKEPCPMCAGALVWSKIDRIVYGATDAKAGACGSAFNLAANKKLNHQIEVVQGIMEQDCEWILKRFFEERRSEGNGQS